MSDEQKPKTESAEEFQQKVKERARLEQIKEATAQQKILLDSKRVANQFEKMQQHEKDVETAKTISFGALPALEVQKIQRENDEYMTAARNPMKFVCESFENIIPFFRKNFILIGARTGQGKSTVVANIVFGLLTSVDPETGKTRRTLVLTNEEATSDFYNRVTSCIRGWPYTNHSKFTEAQKQEFNKMIPVLSNSGRLTVIDNNYQGIHGMTTSIEGIQMIFDSLLEKKEYYDAVIIDYFQNVITSSKNPDWGLYEVQEELGRMIDNFKNIYPAPIVMVAQMKPTKEGDMSPFQERIQGRKTIMNPATLVIEMTADPKNLRTKWTVHKSRFTESVGKDFWTGYDNGRFVKYDTAFAEKVQKIAMDKAARKLNQEIDKSNGIKDVNFKKEEETK